MGVLVKSILVYFVIMNVFGFAFMFVDKQKAKKHAWRIPEKTLFGISILGGSVGTLLGMYTFHHKTKHWYFVLGMPTILIIQIMVIGFLLYKY